MSWWWACLVAAVVLGGCAAPGPEAAPGGAPVMPTPLLLDCLGTNDSIPALESSWFGSCWGHIGHHTYLLPRPETIVAAKGHAFAVEANLTTIAGPHVLTLEASLDALAWQPLGTIPYTSDADDRNDLSFNFTTPPTAARFVRLRMPPSTHDGLAGYLDKSAMTLEVLPAEAPALSGPPDQDCTAFALERFFPTHPCWFGGRDRLDELVGGEPAVAHVAVTGGSDGSYYDSPSFLHTYVVAGSSGSLRAQARIQLWRTPQEGTCAGTYVAAPAVQPTVRVQATPDGLRWSTVDERPAATDGTSTLAGDVPPGTLFLRFGVSPAAGDQGNCHHPAAFLLATGFQLA